MKSFLAKICIKDYKNTADPKVRKAYGILASIVGIVLNILISASKIVFGTIFFSISIVADGLNNLSDAGSSIISLVGFKIAGKPADKEHPFGHARVEYITGMIISFIILFIGLQLLLSSAKGIFSPSKTEFSYIVLGILIGSIVVKLCLALFNRKIGKAIQSSTLKGTAIDSLCDVVATSAVTISLLISHFTKVSLDAYMGILVALFIGFSGIKLLKETLSPLLGEKPNRELVKTIYDKIHKYPLVLGIHDLVVHNYGHHCDFASVHVEMNYKNDILECHELIDQIEREFLEDSINVVIHLDPIVVDDERVTELKNTTINILSQINPALSLHDFRVVWGSHRKNLIFDMVIPHDLKTDESELCALIQQKLQEIDPSLYLIISIDRAYV